MSENDLFENNRGIIKSKKGLVLMISVSSYVAPVIILALGIYLIVAS